MSRPSLPPSGGPHRFDVLIALAGLVGGVLLWSRGLLPTFGSEDRIARIDGPEALALVPLAVVCAAALLRRAGQPWALYAATLALAADLAVGSQLMTVLLFTDVLYASVVYGPGRVARRIPQTVVLLTIVLAVSALAAWGAAAALFVGAVSTAVSVAPAYTGMIVRHHRDEAAAERLRAEQTALLAEMDRVQAVNAERARMARELHDMVANHLSAIAIHSTAALSLEEDPAAARDALGVIRENSVQGLNEMRRLIGILRDAEGTGDTATSPTLDGLAGMLARARSSADEGFEIVLHDERAAGELPAPVELATYRVVQESLTNALKHASPGVVAVRLARQADGHAPLSVEVTSRFGDGARGPRAPGSGAGLVGMRERAELLGGRLEAGPGTGPDGEKIWKVRAELPVRDAVGGRAGGGKSG